MSTFSIGLSGLLASSQNLNGISQNIANSSTAGYKSLSTSFDAAYSGTQPSGVEVSSSTQSFDKKGDMVKTDNNLNVAINGSGFFVLSNGAGSYSYARSGDFSMDSNYNLVALNGMSVQGYGVDSSGNIATGTLTNLKVNETSIPAKASTAITLSANLNADATIPTVTPFDANNASSYNSSIQTQVYDSLGTAHSLNSYYVKTGDGQWDVHYTLDGASLKNPDATDVVNKLTFSSTGAITSTATINLSLNAAPANTIQLNIDPTKITQYSSDFSSISSADGYTSGKISSSYFDNSGNLYAKYDNGQTILQGQLVLASFNNPNGLEAASGTIWNATNDSGAAILGTTGTGSLGSLTIGSYEGSNVDVSTELVDLMSAQQTYQANAKVLSAASDLSSVLFNM